MSFDLDEIERMIKLMMLFSIAFKAIENSIRIGRAREKHELAISIITLRSD